MIVTDYMIGPLSRIPAGEGRTFQVGDQRIAVFHTRDGAVYATQAECPHRGGPLADGLLGGASVICPLHARIFDLRSGEPIRGECALTTYPVRINESGEIVLSLDRALPPQPVWMHET